MQSEPPAGGFLFVLQAGDCWAVLPLLPYYLGAPDACCHACAITLVFVKIVALTD
jgi:hypothetical protein